MPDVEIAIERLGVHRSEVINFDVEVSAELPALKQEAAGMLVRVTAKINPSGVMGIGIASGQLVSNWNGKILGLENKVAKSN